jgi:hypothetical protein
MALANYADLLTSVAGWLNRTDLTATIPDFIRLAETEFNRSLRTIEMEGRATATLTSDAVAVPYRLHRAQVDQDRNHPAEYIAPGEAFDDDHRHPARYTISDGQFFFRPAVNGNGDDRLLPGDPRAHRQQHHQLADDQAPGPLPVRDLCAGRVLPRQRCPRASVEGPRRGTDGADQSRHRARDVRRPPPRPQRSNTTRRPRYPTS